MGLRDSSCGEDEKRSEEKFVRKVKRRTLRRRIRLERLRRGRDTEWSVEEMDRWLWTPEDDPDSCSSEDSLTDVASDESAKESDNAEVIFEHRSNQIAPEDEIGEPNEAFVEIQGRPRTSRESP